MTTRKPSGHQKPIRARAGSGSTWVSRDRCARCAGWQREEASSRSRSQAIAGAGVMSTESKTAAIFRRLPKQPSTDHQVFLPSSGLVIAARATGTGRRDATENLLPSRKPAVTIPRLATSREQIRAPGVEYGPQPNQERPTAAATVNDANRN